METKLNEDLQAWINTELPGAEGWFLSDTAERIEAVAVTLKDEGVKEELIKIVIEKLVDTIRDEYGD